LKSKTGSNGAARSDCAGVEASAVDAGASLLGLLLAFLIVIATVVVPLWTFHQEVVALEILEM
jgi:hypothetical protein